ncbi:hypothetical protein [Candidatus Litorirhabdus singularis]|uniref:hypothetical protein n=1 Tax=Candidatus Litorirhabdus singularis TaxID=2518993 RepID=UPI00242E1455|nr:hypothetical protein [Candidatus Litorirhabdus singularis]
MECYLTIVSAHANAAGPASYTSAEFRFSEVHGSLNRSDALRWSPLSGSGVAAPMLGVR